MAGSACFERLKNRTMEVTREGVNLGINKRCTRSDPGALGFEPSEVHTIVSWVFMEMVYPLYAVDGVSDGLRDARGAGRRPANKSKFLGVGAKEHDDGPR